MLHGVAWQLVWAVGVFAGTSSSVPVIQVECVSEEVVELDAHPTDSSVWGCESPLRRSRSRGDETAPHSIFDMDEQ